MKGKKFIKDNQLLSKNVQVLFGQISFKTWKLNSQVKATISHQFESKEVRLASFKKWPMGLKTGPDEWATAGFFQSPDSDKVALHKDNLSDRWTLRF